MRHSFASTCAIRPAARGPRVSVLVAVVAALLTIFAGRTQAGVESMEDDIGPSPVSLTDLLKLQSIQEVVIDPEGRFAVISIESFDW